MKFINEIGNPTIPQYNSLVHIHRKKYDYGSVVTFGLFIAYDVLNPTFIREHKPHTVNSLLDPLE